MVPDITVSSWVHSSTVTSWTNTVDTLDTQGNRVWVLLTVAGPNASGLGKDSLRQLVEQPVFSSEQLYQWLVHENVVMQDSGASLRVVVMLLAANQAATWLSLGGKLILKREGQIGTLLTGQSIGALEGKVRDTDVFLLSTLAPQHDRLLVSELVSFNSPAATVTSITDQLTNGESARSSADSGAVVSPESNPPQIQTGGIICSAVNIRPTGTTLLPAIESSSESELNQRSIATASGVVTAAGLNSVGSATPASATGQFNSRRWGELVRAPLTLIYRQVSRVTGGIQSLLVKRGVGQQPTVVTFQDLLHKRTRITRRATTILGLVMVGLILVTVAVTLGWSARHNQQREQQLATQTVQPYFEKLQAIRTVSQQDLQAATVQLRQLTAQVTDTIAKPHPASEQPYWSSVVAALTQTKKELLGSDQTVEATVVLNVQAQVPNFAGSVISLDDTQVVMVDQVSKQVVTWEQLTNKVTAFSLGKVGDIKSVTFAGIENGYVLASDGVYYLNLIRQRLELLEVGAAYWKASKYIANSPTFLYFFNVDKRTIYRVKTAQAKAGEPVNWLITPLGVVAEQVNGMWATEAVWLTTKEAQIKQYISGRPTGFAFTSLEKPWDSPLQVLSPPDSAYIYVFAPSQSSLYIFSQSGELLRQVTNPVLGGCVSVAVDETRGRFLAVSGSVVYQLPLWPQPAQ